MTIETAKRKYARKVPVMATNYLNGMASFLGVNPGQISASAPVANYRDKIRSGVEDKWEKNLKIAFGI
jgi:hypothetical protein